MRLLLVELRRLMARQVVLLTVLGAVAVAVVSLVGVANQARQLESARAGADTEYQRMVEDNERVQEECRLAEAEERRRSGDASVDFGCDDFAVPTIEEFYGQLPPMAEQLQFLFQGASYPLMFLALAIGSTAVAAEFAHRTMATWLTFVPRRTPVFVSKVLAPALASTPVVLTGLALLLVGTPVVYAVFGLDRSMPDGWGPPVWTSLRILVLGMVAAVFAYQGAFAAGAVVIAVGIVLTVADRVVGNHRLTEYNNTRARLRQIPVARRAVQTVRSVRGRVAAEPVPVDDLLTRPTEKPGWKDPEPDTPGT